MWPSHGAVWLSRRGYWFEVWWLCLRIYWYIQMLKYNIMQLYTYVACTPGVLRISNYAHVFIFNCLHSVTWPCSWVCWSPLFFYLPGRVPDCERCHECFFQWDDIVSNITNEISVLQTRVELLITLNYDGYTIAGIEMEVAFLLNQLSQANQSLNSITLQTSSVIAAKASLTQVSNLIFIESCTVTVHVLSASLSILCRWTQVLYNSLHSLMK